MKPSGNPLPTHIGIILDGNRRFAKRLMIKPWKGHEWGAKKVHNLFDWCKELGIKELTLYCFSYENFNRPKEEFDYLMNVFRKEFEDLKKDKRLHDDKIRINFIGRLNMFPQDIQEKFKNIMDITKGYNKYIINFAMAYSGRIEIIDAVRNIAQQVKEGNVNVDQINEDLFADNLYMKDEPDMIIRTGGEKRTSNFLNFQSAYSEWFYLEKMWPEFDKSDFVACIEEYKQRQRRFGS